MSILVVVLCIFTLLVLVAGVVVMVKGGKINKEYSNKLMQARIYFQAITIAVLALIIYASK
jgi:hypothetical protein